MIRDERLLTAPLRVLGDPTRLRILGLVELEELSVGELGRCLGMSQSRVSNHLRVLREERFLRQRHAGPSTYLKLALEEDEDGARDLKARLWQALRAELARLPEREADLARLAAVLGERRAKDRDFFEALAGRWDKIGVDFQSGQARQRAALNLLPAGMVVADVGCGTGYLARALVGVAARIVLVDGSLAMLEEARANLEPVPAGTALELRQGELDALPIEDGELDGLVCGMVLHHLADLERPLAEMRRVLKPGAPAVVLELQPHREAWMHAAFGDRHLGLDPRDVRAAFARAGLVDVRLEAVDDRYRPARPAPPLGAPLPPAASGVTQAPGDANGGAQTTSGAEPPPGASAAASLSLYIVRGRAPADAA